MSLRSQNFGHQLWLALLAIGLMLPTTNVVSATVQQEAQESTAEVKQAESAAGAQIKEVLTKALNPEGMAGTPNTLTPPPILAEKNIADEQTQETMAPKRWHLALPFVQGSRRIGPINKRSAANSRLLSHSR